MFVDEINVKLVAGAGGNGCTSFHHEKSMANMGPDGGNGGKGASIIFKVDKGLKTLVDLRYNKIIKGDKGINGKGSDRTGANANDIIIKVPQGTVITDLSNNQVIADLINDNDEIVVAKGGRGGKGNHHFATHDNPNPRFSENGEPGEIKNIKCELKVLADVGLVGFPSVGKSTLLSLISASKPKIAAYHFTTLSPNLGVVNLKDHRFFIMADLPGLIEGAAEGLGLGLKFLRHATRCKIIAHIIDMASVDGRDPIKDYEIINNEIMKYGHGLDKKKQIVIASKMDLENAKTNLDKFKKHYNNIEVIPISAFDLESIDKLIIKLADELDNYEEIVDEVKNEDEVVFKYVEEKPFEITKENNIWIIKGDKIEKLFKMTKFNEDEGVLRFANKLKKMGVEEELLKLGANKGDDVMIEDFIFQFKD